MPKAGAHYIEASAEDIDMSNKLVLVNQKDAQGNLQRFYIPYDKLVISVGSNTNTHGVDGLKHAHFLKSIADARAIRNHIMDNFELACLPTTSDEERKRLLSFVVAGGGPTGVEFASELFDMLQEDLTPYVCFL
jgi:NADH:ubiquinone reductase (H+-translocating)